MIANPGCIYGGRYLITQFLSFLTLWFPALLEEPVWEGLDSVVQGVAVASWTFWVFSIGMGFQQNSDGLKQRATVLKREAEQLKRQAEEDGK